MDYEDISFEYIYFLFVFCKYMPNVSYHVFMYSANKCSWSVIVELL